MWSRYKSESTSRFSFIWNSHCGKIFSIQLPMFLLNPHINLLLPGLTGTQKKNNTVLCSSGNFVPHKICGRKGIEHKRLEVKISKRASNTHLSTSANYSDLYLISSGWWSRSITLNIHRISIHTKGTRCRKFDTAPLLPSYETIYV